MKPSMMLLTNNNYLDIKQTVEHIDLFSAATILQICQPILTALNANKNHQHVLLFARKLDYHLRTKFFTGNWSNNSLQKAINQLKGDRTLSFFFCKKLLQKHLNSRITNQALESGSFCFCNCVLRQNFLTLTRILFDKITS